MGSTNLRKSLLLGSRKEKIIEKTMRVAKNLKKIKNTKNKRARKIAFFFIFFTIYGCNLNQF